MTAYSPDELLGQLAEALPVECRESTIVIGSLAAAYHFFGGDREKQVQTKDIDCLLSPNVKAIPVARTVVERLLDSKWEPRYDPRWPAPGTAETPLDDLPMVRLCPPGKPDWNIELLNAPDAGDPKLRVQSRLETRYGHFQLCSFSYLALAEIDPLPTPHGILVARPEMMALANALHHPVIGEERMAGTIEGRKIKRSNKDLGRVLALAWLAERKNPDALLDWAGSWERGLRTRFPAAWNTLAARAGLGIEALLASEADLEEAHHTAIYGLLRSFMLGPEALAATGLRLMLDAVKPLKRAADEHRRTSH